MYRKSLILMVVFISFSLFNVLLSFNVYAEARIPGSEHCYSANLLGIPQWYQYVPLSTDCNINTGAISQKNIIPILIAMGIFDIILYLTGMIAAFIIMYGGFRYLISAGEPQKISAAKTTIINAIVGLVIALVASQIVGFIAGKLV